MTGEPGFTFRGRDDAPSCTDCGAAMALEREEADRLEERDVYACGDCGTRVTDRWTF